MNRKELLIINLIEELAEVQQALIKVLRFTEQDHFDGLDQNNIERVHTEWSDVIAIKELLSKEGFDIYESPYRIEIKKEKFERFAQHSRDLGTLT
jgi:hypothetical protein